MPERAQFKCNECGKVFTRSIGARTTEAKCPKCHGVDTEPTGWSPLIGPKPEWMR